jgi:hypothetical protein
MSSIYFIPHLVLNSTVKKIQKKVTHKHLISSSWCALLMIHRVIFRPTSHGWCRRQKYSPSQSISIVCIMISYFDQQVVGESDATLYSPHFQESMIRSQRFLF